MKVDIKNFVYDEENHLGYYNGKLIPSITQLVAMKYPMGMISKDRLDKASSRGTKVHNDIELYNKGIISTCETTEGKNYVKLVNDLALEPVKSEFKCFITNSNGEILAYGTCDGVFQCKKYIVVNSLGKIDVRENVESGDTCLYVPNQLIMFDIKTVSLFENEKVELQENMYRLGYQYEETPENICGVWVRDDIVQFRPLISWTLYETQKQFESCLQMWKEENE